MPSECFPSESDIRTLSRHIERLIRAGQETPWKDGRDAMDLLIFRDPVAEINAALASIERERVARQPSRVVGKGWPRGMKAAIGSIAASMARIRVAHGLDREITNELIFARAFGNGGVGDHPDPTPSEGERAVLAGILSVLDSAIKSRERKDNQ